MGLDRPIEAAEKAVDSAKSATKNLCPWLPDPHTCQQCGAYCDASMGYVAEQAMTVRTWECPDCGSRYYRHRE